MSCTFAIAARGQGLGISFKFRVSSCRVPHLSPFCLVGVSCLRGTTGLVESKFPETMTAA